jgi:creatinine amidohydrolase/Fe(II)-dependent formamide hydrolase-like protein
MARRRAAVARRKTLKKLPAVDLEKSAGRKRVKVRADDPLAVLEVIDRLEVGPVRVEKRRLVAPYVVTQGRKRQRFELIYRWEEDVFQPGEAESLNLAALIAAQPALNYGLFCRELVFRGPLDAHDRRFLQDMARNTAREIYVKKFLEPNPFLLAPATGLPAVQRSSYVRAKLVFPDALPRRARAARWARDRSRHAVLSSGGKDSLLSFGLLRELGLPTDAIYVNESGRHWFTALNAFRHMERAFPGTARVWTNADRLFAWMLRRLPFVRRDFQDVRSDEYPIRLWTVAVFLFGALPLMRKRGLARLVIGDEIDTSRRATHAGIPHYDGLFDQSRWFDDAMSRFFARKGWGVAQFSILRPLSELLIQKILVQRYPELQEHQVSCHATHSTGGRALPCGVCEKCRRIVGMLLAVGADPTRCGYTAAQVADALAQLAQKGVAQEAETAEQVLWMLQGQGRWQPSAQDVRPPRERPEALALRFDPERSPMDDIPVDLRAPLYGIYRQYAQGALRRQGRVWLPFDPLADAELHRPYPYERGADAPAPGARRASEAAAEGAGAAGPRPWLLGELTWPAAERRFKEVDVALLPVGSLEQHGPHLPLDVDAFDAEYLAQQIGARCSDPRPLVLPLIPYGVSYNHDDFPGTLSIGPETLTRMVHEIGLAAARQGITKLVVINGHGGNAPALRLAAQMINRDAHIFTCVDTGESSDADVGKLAATRNDVHAGEIETSTTMALRPHLVHMERARKHVPSFSGAYLDFNSARSVEWFARTARISRSGVMGDPTRASREKGEAMWEAMIRNMVEFVEQLKGMSLDEIWQKRY